MNINEIRTKYLEFFSARAHMPVPSSSLVPGNDPTTLFTGSGMQPLIPYLLGKDHLPWFFQFLTEEVGIDARNLYVTAFIGDESPPAGGGIPRDTESAAIWK